MIHMYTMNSKFHPANERLEAKNLQENHHCLSAYHGVVGAATNPSERGIRDLTVPK